MGHLPNHDPVFLVGATGTGKSAAAMEGRARDSARAGICMAILCMDAMQVYRGADIGTSKPTAAERAEFSARRGLIWWNSARLSMWRSI